MTCRGWPSAPDQPNLDGADRLWAEDIPTFEAWLKHAYGEEAEEVRRHMQEPFAGTQRSLNIEFPIQTRTGEERY